jgi:hypothetical protein
VWLGIAVALAVLALARGLRIRGGWLIGLLTLAVITGSIITWTLSGDDPGSGLSRQFLAITLALRVGILLAIAFSADALCSSSRTALTAT